MRRLPDVHGTPVPVRRTVQSRRFHSRVRVAKSPRQDGGTAGGGNRDIHFRRRETATAARIRGVVAEAAWNPERRLRRRKPPNVTAISSSVNRFRDQHDIPAAIGTAVGSDKERKVRRCCKRVSRPHCFGPSRSPLHFPDWNHAGPDPDVPPVKPADLFAIAEPSPATPTPILIHKAKILLLVNDRYTQRWDR